MTRSPSIVTLVVIAALLATPEARATSQPGEPGVDVIYLVRDCELAGLDESTCFETVPAVQDYLWGSSGKFPDAEEPLVVDIGVGTFVGKLSCPTGQGHVTFRGVGREHSVLQGVPPAGLDILPKTFFADNCSNLEFKDLTIDAPGGGMTKFPVSVGWKGGGSSVWTNVDLRAEYTTWLDEGDTCTGNAIHYFFGSLIVSTGSHGYAARCGEHWFYGTEIRMEAAVDNGNSAPGRKGLLVGGSADARVFGGAIRSFPAPGFEEADDFIGVQIIDSGVFHMHGGIISVSAGETSNDAIGIDSFSSNGFSHTLETAFVVNVASNSEVAGESIRLRGAGKVLSPMLWQAGAYRPGTDSDDANDHGVKSLHGQDLFVETDCTSNGDCGSGVKAQAHLMIYDDSCGDDVRWRNAVTGLCRNDTLP